MRGKLDLSYPCDKFMSHFRKFRCQKLQNRGKKSTIVTYIGRCRV